MTEAFPLQWPAGKREAQPAGEISGDELENVAKALMGWYSDTDCNDWDKAAQHWKDECLVGARLAITAMKRESVEVTDDDVRETLRKRGGMAQYVLNQFYKAGYQIVRKAP